MSQDNPQITTTPPLPGLQLVQDMNKALETIATDFAGSTDPAAMAWPYSTWADTGTGTFKRRNAANSAWVIEGRLLRAHLPMYAQVDVPALDIGPIYIIGKGPAEWIGAAYKILMPGFPSNDDLQWLGTPIGGYITPLTPPPTDDPRFRYVLCTAGEDGVGGYNEGILTGETVTGSAPLVEATAVVDLDGSPFDGLTIHLVNTEERFIGAAESERVQDDSLQEITGQFIGMRGDTAALGQSTGGEATGAFAAGDVTTRSYVTQYVAGGPGYPLDFKAGRVARTSTQTRPRSLMLPHYRRIL